MGISDAGKSELALALILWKSFKSDHKMDIDIFSQALKLADYIGVREEFDELDRKLLIPFNITWG